MDIIEFKNQIWEYTRKIEESMNSVFSPISERYGLTMMQARILMELHQGNTNTIGSLAERTCIAGTNISAMCKKLEVQGFVERVRNKEDERVVMVILTALGKKTVAEIDKACCEKISQHIKDETEEAFDDIISGLKKLNDILFRME
jgi:DNA-binding MarR family transcriptional regulator